MSVISTNQSSVLKVQEANGRYREAMAAEVLAAAEGVLSGMIVGTVLMNRPETAESYLKVKLAALEHEVFGCLFLDSAHRLIEYRELFRGTLNQTAVYPREVIKAALAVNAGAVIFVHNHPSGAAEPSRADELLTETLRKALLMIGVETLDHLIVARSTVVSMARRGCFAI